MIFSAMSTISASNDYTTGKYITITSWGTDHCGEGLLQFKDFRGNTLGFHPIQVGESITINTYDYTNLDEIVIGTPGGENAYNGFLAGIQTYMFDHRFDDYHHVLVNGWFYDKACYYNKLTVPTFNGWYDQWDNLRLRHDPANYLCFVGVGRFTGRIEGHNRS